MWTEVVYQNKTSEIPVCIRAYRSDRTHIMDMNTATDERRRIPDHTYIPWHSGSKINMSVMTNQPAVQKLVISRPATSHFGNFSLKIRGKFYKN